MLELKKLEYGYDDLNPVINSETISFHHDKHHQTYYDNTNNLIKGTSLEDKGLEYILTHLEEADESIRTKLKNQAGGAYNHDLYWNIINPKNKKELHGELEKAINEAFGSFDAFKEKFVEEGLKVFGSGWIWLVKDSTGLKIMSTSNQDCPITDGFKIIFGNDVWEHAYYLDYQNRRKEYLEKWFDLVNWTIAEEIYTK
jgi:superoxide dismutase [Mn] 2